MSCEQVLIWNCLSTAYGTMLLNLQRNRPYLKEQNIGYVHTDRIPPYGLLSHESLVRQLRRVQTLEHYDREKLSDRLKSFNTDACQYRTLLLAVSCPWVKPLEQLRRAFRSLPELRRARIRLVLHLSPQDIVLEQQLRLTGNKEGLEFRKKEWLQSDVCNFADMAARLAASYGKSNFSVRIGEADPAMSPYDADAEQQMYSMLGALFPPPSVTLRCRLILRSREARHIQFLYGQLNNAWPKENNPSLLLSALEKAEHDLAPSGVLDFRPMLAPEEVHALRERCAEGNAQLSAHYSATEKLLTFPPERDMSSASLWKPYMGLRPEAVAALAACLPESLADSLCEALRVSEPILTAQQRIVLTALDERRPRPAWRPTAPEARVSVLVQTYNQEAYVAEALDSILAQETDFGVEIVVVDDASTDGTRKVIDRYARHHGNIRPIFLFRRSNAGQNTLALFRHVRTPYVAICDGDDYFTDPKKLQIQADYLDAHSDCSLCFHPVRLVWEDGGPDSIYPDDSVLPHRMRSRYYLSDLMRANFIQTNSVMYRWRFRSGIPGWFDPMLVPSDWYWHLLHAEQGYIGFINRIMSVYRRHEKSLFWRPRDASTVSHRLRFGMQELRLYQKCMLHFGNKGTVIFQNLASGVFHDLVKHQIETKDATLLNKAVRYYPELGKIFLDKLKSVQS